MICFLKIHTAFLLGLGEYFLKSLNKKGSFLNFFATRLQIFRHQCKGGRWARQSNPAFFLYVSALSRSRLIWFDLSIWSILEPFFCHFGSYWSHFAPFSANFIHVGYFWAIVGQLGPFLAFWNRTKVAVLDLTWMRGMEIFLIFSPHTLIPRYYRIRPHNLEKFLPHDPPCLCWPLRHLCVFEYVCGVCAHVRVSLSPNQPLVGRAGFCSPCLLGWLRGRGCKCVVFFCVFFLVIFAFLLRQISIMKNSSFWPDFPLRPKIMSIFWHFCNFLSTKCLFYEKWNFWGSSFRI